MNTDDPFFNLYNHGFVRVAVGIPTVRVADPAYNARETIVLMTQAAERKALLVVFPELGLSAYSCEDLFQRQAFLDGCTEQLASLLHASQDIPVIAICLGEKSSLNKEGTTPEFVRPRETKSPSRSLGDGSSVGDSISRGVWEPSR